MTAIESYITLSKKWVSACKLKAGEKVLLSDGKYGIITSVKVEELEPPETTYNFEVEDFHTYFVSESNVLVHNMCGTPETAPDDFTKLKMDKVGVIKMEMCGKKICYTRIIGMYQIKKV